MSNVIPFPRPVSQEKNSPQHNCALGNHEWKVWQQKHYDIRSGKLATIKMCIHCGEVKLELLDQCPTPTV